MSGQQDCAVIIVGGGPCGLALAIELGRRDVSTILLEEKTSPARFPAANATQARTMEHYRRLGFAEQVRAQGLPPDYPTDIAYFTRYTKHELARFSLPSAQAAREIVRTLTGSWSAAELPHRVSQMYVEDVLRAQAAACPSISIRTGWRMTGLRETGNGVEVDAEHNGGGQTIRGAYAFGADGGTSPTRKTLGFSFVGEGGVVRDFMGGRMFAIYFRSPELYSLLPHPRAWMYWAVNRERRGFMASVNGHDLFTFHTQLRQDQHADQITDQEAKAMFHTALAAKLGVEIIARSTWNAGYTLVAEKFRRGRVFLGGDAAHLFTPTGGLGYNTAVEDAVNLGWKLAATVKGWGKPKLLDSYETERQALAKRNTAYARGFAELGRAVRSGRGDRGRQSGGRSSAQNCRRPSQCARASRVQHSGHHVRRTLRWVGDHRAGRHHAAARCSQHLRRDRLPRRTRAAPVARRRALALRHVRLRVHAAAVWRQGAGRHFVHCSSQGAERTARCRRGRLRRSPRSLCR